MRQRTPSGHDIPIPESVFQAIAQVQREGQETRTEVAAIRSDVRDINKAVTTLAARRNSNMWDLVKIIAPAALAIIGGQKVLTPTPEPARVEVIASPIDKRMAECMPLQPGTQAQAEVLRPGAGGDPKWQAGSNPVSQRPGRASTLSSTPKNRRAQACRSPRTALTPWPG